MLLHLRIDTLSCLETGGYGRSAVQQDHAYMEAGF